MNHQPRKNGLPGEDGGPDPNMWARNIWQGQQIGQAAHRFEQRRKQQKATGDPSTLGDVLAWLFIAFFVYAYFASGAN